MNKNISIIVPCFNEEKAIRNFHSILNQLLNNISKKKKINFSIFFIDDGSTDKTFEILKELSEKFLNVVVVKFSKNFGKVFAILCGLKKNYDKDGLIVMDCDLQHPIDHIMLMINKWEEGFNLIIGKRKNKTKKNILRNLGSYIFNMIQFGNSHSLTDYSFISKEILLLLKKNYNEKNFVFKNFLNDIGFDNKKYFFDFVSPDRIKGTSSFSILNLSKMFLTSLFNYSIWPLKISVFIGLGILILSLVGILFMYLHELLNQENIYTMQAYFLVINTFLSGLIIFTVGICTIYIAIVLKEIQDRPTYIIEEYIDNSPK